MVHSGPCGVAKCNVTFCFCVAGGLEERSINHPGECPRVGVNQIATLANFEARRAKQFARGGRFTRTEEDAVAGLSTGCFRQSFAFSIGNVLGNGATEGAVFTNGDVSEALCTACLRPFLPLVKGATRLGSTAGHDDCADVGSLEDSERGVFEVFGQVNQFEAEAKVGLVGAVLFHRVFVGHSRKRGRQVVADELPDVRHDIFGDSNDVILINEAHFNVKLGEFRLTISAEVLVTVATCDLEVAFHTGNHEHLLKQLRGLRKCVPRAGRQTSRDDEVASTFGGRTRQGRGFDFDKVVCVESVTSGARHLRTKTQRVLFRFATKVEVTVLQASFFANVAGVFCVRRDLERKRCGRIEDFNVVAHHFDGAGGQVRVLVTLGASTHLAGDLEDEFGAELVGDGFVADDNLCNTGCIAEIDECNAAVITAAIHPTGQSNGLTDKVGIEGANVMSAQHVSSFHCGHPRDGRRHRDFTPLYALLFTCFARWALGVGRFAGDC